MEDFTRAFIYLSYLLPGFGLLLSTGICFLLLMKMKPALWFKNLPTALLITSIIILISWIGLHILSEFKGPYKLVFYSVMSLLCFYVLKSENDKLKKVLLPLYLILYVIFDWQTTHVSQSKVLSGKWYPTDGRIALQFPGGCVEVKSDQALTYLEIKKSSRVDLTLDVHYQNGSFAGYNVREIDGKAFDYDDDVVAGYCKVEGKFSFPLYSFALRGLSFNRTRPHVNSDWIPLKR